MAPRTPKKCKIEPVEENSNQGSHSDDAEVKSGKQQKKMTECFKQKKRLNRFDGMTDEEVMKRTLPDHLACGLDIIIIGINPGLFAAFKGHHYAGPGNHFWKCLYLAGLIPTPMNAVDDFKLLNMGIGFTNIVTRATKGSADLSKKELREGAHVLIQKLKTYQPKIAAFNGKMIYESFTGKKKFGFGVQSDTLIEGTNIKAFVMPSSSARCAQLPRAIDKVPFYIALKKYRDHIKGFVPDLDLSEVTFPDVKMRIEHKEESVDNESSNMDIVKSSEPLSATQNTLNSDSVSKEQVNDEMFPYKYEREDKHTLNVNGVLDHGYQNNTSELCRLNPFIEDNDNATTTTYFESSGFGDTFGVDNSFGFQPIWYGRPTAQPVSPAEQPLLSCMEIKQELLD